jgi:hypothetical protein
MDLIADAGFLLIVSGIILMAAQFIWPDHFQNLQKQFAGWGLNFTTNVPGFALVVMGVLLLIVGRIGALAIK